GSSSGQVLQTSSGVRSESRISSSRCSTCGLSAMAWPPHSPLPTHPSPLTTPHSPVTTHHSPLTPPLIGLKVAHILRQEPQATIQAPISRHGRDGKHVRGLSLRHPLDAHQTKHFPLVLA